MSKAIVLRDSGGPEVLRTENIEVGKPGEGEVRLRQAAVGVNFIDTYHRSGLYPVPKPFIPGMEGVGTITDIGPGVKDLKPGDRVCYASALGGYAEERLIKAELVVKVPPKLRDEQVAGMMLRGLTVWYLLKPLHQLKAGETVLFHAAAGGLGLIFCQWARAIGATVIGTVGSPEKVKAAEDAGCSHVILYRQEDWVKKVREITGGNGVSVVYDGVGKDTFAGSLDCLQRRGLMVCLGNASGPAPAFEPSLLNNKGSLFLTRPKLNDYIAKREEFVSGSNDLFDVVLKGQVKIDVGQSFALDQAPHAHDDLENRRTTGSTVLVM